MGLGDFTPDFIDDAVEAGAEKVGEGIDWVGDQTADGLDKVGLEGAADWTREKTDAAANYLGAIEASSKINLSIGNNHALLWRKSPFHIAVSNELRGKNEEITLL